MLQRAVSAVPEDLFVPSGRTFALRFWDGTVEGPKASFEPGFTLVLKRPGALKRFPLPHRPAAVSVRPHIWARSKGEVSPFTAFRKLRKAGAVKIKDRQSMLRIRGNWSATLKLYGLPNRQVGAVGRRMKRVRQPTCSG